MRWPEAGADPFPFRNRLEPDDLRRDILDELADHLALAAEHEMTRAGQPEDKAWEQALARFGNPDALARRLWWDAMRERIMRDWIQTGIAAVSAAVVVLAAVFLAYSMRQMQTMQATQTELLKTVKELGTGNTPEPAGLALEVEVRRGAPEGPPAAGVRVVLFGKPAGDETATAVLETDAEGRARFYPVPQGKYYLKVDDPQSTMKLDTSHSLFAGTGSTLRILAPDCTAVETRFVVKPELPFRDERALVAASFSVEDKVGDFTWSRKGTVLVGRAGVYANQENMPLSGPPRRENPGTLNFRRTELGPPQGTAKMPPLRFAFREIQPALLFARPGERSRVALISRIGQGGNATEVAFQPAPGEANTVTLQLTEEQGAAAERVMKVYSVASRWWRQDMPDSPSTYEDLDKYATALHGYVVDALLLKDAVTVEPSAQKGAKMSLGVRENRREGDVVWGGDEKNKSVALRLPDAGELVRSYPADCRFVFSCANIDDASISAWSGDEWSTEVGSSFAVSLGDGLHWSRAHVSAMQNPLADVTKLIRGENKSRPATGLLVQFKQGGGVVLDGLSADQKWYLPHILVVSDSPPGDL
jgi:hypothetical protein